MDKQNAIEVIEENYLPDSHANVFFNDKGEYLIIIGSSSYINMWLTKNPEYEYFELGGNSLEFRDNKVFVRHIY